MSSASPIDVFFARRVTERLVPWYFERHRPWLDQHVVVNSVPQPVTMRDAMEGTAAFFEGLGARECMLSQGDFSETNVGRGAVFVDLSNAGYNDVRGELATAFWSLFLGGGYLFPKYHPAAYRWREAPYADAAPLCRARPDPRTATLHIDLAHRLSPARADLLGRLLDVFADAFGPGLFDRGLAPYLVMRAVGVLDLDTLDPRTEPRAPLWCCTSGTSATTSVTFCAHLSIMGGPDEGPGRGDRPEGRRRAADPPPQGRRGVLHPAGRRSRGGETPEQACVRELAEETGLRAAVESPLHTLDNAGRAEHYFVMGPATGTPRLGGPESERDSGDNQYRLVWVPLADVASIGLKPDAITSHLVGIPNTVR